jgi:alpha-1,3-rhamnosyl/mannosyltransferase
MRRLGIDARKLADYGIGSYLQGLLAELTALCPDDEIVVLAQPDGRHLLPELPDRWRIVEVEAVGYTVREQIEIPVTALRAGVGLLHVPHYVLPLLYPGSLVVTVHDIIHVMFPEFLPSRIGFAYARFLIRAAIRRARRVITVSESTASDLRRLFGASGEKLRVIPNGVHEAFLAAGDVDGDAANRSKLGVQPPYLLHVGNDKPHKNTASVLKAYQLLANQRAGGVPPLILAGGFTDEGPLAARARAMGLGDRVRSLGHLERNELAALYRGATIFVYPTLYEGFGLPVLEAMGCGVPVVAGDVPAVREVAEDAVVRVNPRDVEAIAGAVRRLLERDELRTKMSERGRSMARRYGWRRAAEATLSVYRAARQEA